jgi:hypothetical protein
MMITPCERMNGKFAGSLPAVADLDSARVRRRKIRNGLIANTRRQRSQKRVSRGTGRRCRVTAAERDHERRQW